MDNAVRTPPTRTRADRGVAMAMDIPSGIVVLIAVMLGARTARVEAADQVRLEITRDTWVSSYPGEEDANLGGAGKLKLKGIQEFSLIDVDPAPLRGRVVEGATLHLFALSRDVPLRVTVSTLATDWVEGTARSYRTQAGSAAFTWAAHGTRRWAHAGSDLTAVMHGVGQTRWSFADAGPPDERGHRPIGIDPLVVAARVAGISHGLVLFDDVGSEYTRDGMKFAYHVFRNRFVASREARPDQRPYVTVRLGPVDDQAPGPIADLRVDTTGLPAGEAMLTWTTPRDAGAAGTIGFHLRWHPDPATPWDACHVVPRCLIPLAGAPGEPVVMRLRDLETRGQQRIALRARAVDAAGNAGPDRAHTVALAPGVAIDLAPAPADAFTAPPGPHPALSVVDALDKVHPETGRLVPSRRAGYRRANHLWSASRRLVRLYAARNETVSFQVVLAGASAGLRPSLAFGEGPDAPRVTWHRLGHVRTPAGRLTDPLVPLNASAPGPPAPPGCTALLADVHVPHGAAPGPRRAVLRLRDGDRDTGLNIALHVWDFTLPDHLSFIPQMNCYGLPEAHERAYYRLAHEHRTCLNRLGYNWRGRVHPGLAPVRRGTDFDWSAFDRRFGPLLDGSAFADLPRRNVAVEAFYLPINETWPMDLAAHFRGGYWADAALPAAYWRELSQAAAAFARHFAARRWHDTFFEFYLNNKVYHKKDRWDRASAPWVFDEPANTQDFWALRCYGLAFQRGVAPVRGRVKMAFRCDISRPQWQRDLLDGVLDVNVVGGDGARYARMVMDRKDRYGEIVYQYGSTNHVAHDNLQAVRWCLRAWAFGADGVLPWQTIGTERSWQEGDPLCLFYPPRAGSTGPLPSVRLLAYRRGQQDVEYLTILAALLDVPRHAAAAAVRRALAADDEAGDDVFATADPIALWRLRTRVGAIIDRRRPAPRLRWRELRTPDRHVDGLRRDHLVATP